MIHCIKTLDDLARLLPEIIAGKLVICDRDDVKPNVGGGDQPPRDAETQVGGGDQPERGED